jgi:hypothetical protein
LIKEDPPDSGNDVIINFDDDAIEDITKIRSIGFAGSGEDKTTRAVQVKLEEPVT